MHVMKFRNLLLALALVCGPTLAEAAQSHTVAPLVIDIEVEARDIITREITLTNTGTQPLTVYPTVN